MTVLLPVVFKFNALDLRHGTIYLVTYSPHVTSADSFKRHIKTYQFNAGRKIS